jgi:hypothetical protein
MKHIKVFETYFSQLSEYNFSDKYEECVKAAISDENLNIQLNDVVNAVKEGAKHGWLPNEISDPIYFTNNTSNKAKGIDPVKVKMYITLYHLLPDGALIPAISFQENKNEGWQKPQYNPTYLAKLKDMKVKNASPNYFWKKIYDQYTIAAQNPFSPLPLDKKEFASYIRACKDAAEVDKVTPVAFNGGTSKIPRNASEFKKINPELQEQIKVSGLGKELSNKSIF